MGLKRLADPAMMARRGLTGTGIGAISRRRVGAVVGDADNDSPDQLGFA